MSNKFFSKTRDNDDDDLLEKQLSVLGDKNGNENDNGSENQVNEILKQPKEEIPEPQINIEKKSIIQSDMVITGAINAETSLFIYGVVNGNIDCKNDVKLYGKVKGNINALSLEINEGNIVGDIDCKGIVTMFKGSSVHGNITCNSISCDGKVEGNTHVTEKAEIKDNAVVLGDIACSIISIREGAVCKGNIQTGGEKTVSEKAETKVNEKPAKTINTNLKQYI